MGSIGDALDSPTAAPPPTSSSTSSSLLSRRRRRRILFIDAYDSFSNNITSLLSTLLDVDVLLLPVDTPISKDAFRRELTHYEAVVCGPGPGSPLNEADVGLMRWLWELERHELVPVLGVCLGFQSLVLACGGKVRRLRRGLHGMVRTIDHLPRSATPENNIFEGVEDFRATLYHSLCADIGQDAVSDWKKHRWEFSPGHEDFIPLAWVEEDRGPEQTAERILMAVKHRNKPFWGVQYHPESVCTEEEGNKVVKNWFTQALRWNSEHGRIANAEFSNMLGRNAVRQSLLQPLYTTGHRQKDEQNIRDTMLDKLDQTVVLRSQTLPLPHGVEVPHIAEILNTTYKNHIILDSANGNQPPPMTGVDVRGRFSIVALEVDDCLRIEYHTGDSFATVRNIPDADPGLCEHVPLGQGQSIWHFLAEFQESRRLSLQGPVPDEKEIPFLGGLIGYVTYEQGLSDIHVSLRRDRGHQRPDICMAWVTKSIVVDHEKQVLHVQNIKGDDRWVNIMAAKLEGSNYWRRESVDQNGSHGWCFPANRVETVVQKPQQAKYEAKVRMCQEYIAAGNSYELCLTDQTRITRTFAPRSHQQDRRSANTNAAPVTENDCSSSWDLYRTLRRRNPAPFASYLRLGGATLVSSSPERFLTYDRAGSCSMKPMKGTVKKVAATAAAATTAAVAPGAATTLAEAEAILHVPKEEAENLMIVDLVRHDLHGICGAGRVTVPDLLKVEEYQTVYTMITRVEGQLPQPPPPPPPSSSSSSTGPRYSGLDVLAASLPPGSMTGAPKKRSCEILQQVEDGRERSLYSGVVGYMCVTGRGDWSVTIRSMFRWDDESRARGQQGGGGGGLEGEKNQETWHIGAGGAVTILSTPEGEREEMFVKLARPLSIFTEDT